MLFHFLFNLNNPFLKCFLHANQFPLPILLPSPPLSHLFPSLSAPLPSLLRKGQASAWLLICELSLNKAENKTSNQINKAEYRASSADNRACCADQAAWGHIKVKGENWLLQVVLWPHMLHGPCTPSHIMHIHNSKYTHKWYFTASDVGCQRQLSIHSPRSLCWKVYRNNFISPPWIIMILII